MSTAGGPNLVKTGLEITTDTTNPKSISDSNFLNLKGRSSLGNPSWANGASELTVIVIIDILGNNTGYAYHPINKWNGGTSSASFVLYHFQNYQGNRPYDANRLRWYANRGGSWSSISSSYVTTVGNKYFVALQYDSSLGGQLWINSSKIGGREGSGVLGTGSSGIGIDGGVSGRSGIHKVEKVSFYSRHLSDSEILRIYNAYKGRL